jgi:catalase
LRDLWEAIEAGAFPEWELSVQLFTEEQADGFSFDVLDATKLVPEELGPLTPVGRMVLNRNPDHFFAETEQVAFCTAHIVPGLDFSNDPLLASRIHSYVDTRITRLGGPNFHEIPINSPVAQAHNNHRDGMHRQQINRGRANYEPNSLGGGCPFQAGTAGFTFFMQPTEGDKVRAKPELFADHFTQATLFCESQTEVGKAHIANALRFELTPVQPPAIRERVVSMLLKLSQALSEQVARDLGMDEPPPPMPKALQRNVTPEVVVSPTLSLFARPGDGSIRTRRIAIMIADGVDGPTATTLHAALAAEGAVPRYVGPRLGAVKVPTVQASRSRLCSRPCRRRCSTRVRSPAANKQSRSWQTSARPRTSSRSDTGIASRSLPSARQRRWWRPPAYSRNCPRVSPIPVCCCLPREASPQRFLALSRRSASIGISGARLILRRSDVMSYDIGPR